MLKFVRSNGAFVAFNLSDDAVPEIKPTDAFALVALVADGAEKKMLAKSGVKFPRFHGPVTLPDQIAKLVAFNLGAIVETFRSKFHAKPKPLALPTLAEDAEDEDAEEEDSDD